MLIAPFSLIRHFSIILKDSQLEQHVFRLIRHPPALHCSFLATSDPFISGFLVIHDPTLLLLCILVQLILINVQTILPQCWSPHILTPFTSLLSEPLPGSSPPDFASLMPTVLCNLFISHTPGNHPVSPVHSQSNLTKSSSFYWNLLITHSLMFICLLVQSVLVFLYLKPHVFNRFAFSLFPTCPTSFPPSCFMAFTWKTHDADYTHFFLRILCSDLKQQNTDGEKCI